MESTMLSFLMACVESEPLDCGAGTHLEGSSCVADEDTGSAPDSAGDSADPAESGDDSSGDSAAGSGDATVCPDGTGAFTTIQAAIDAASDGDIITVCPGTYAEVLVVERPLSVTSTSGAAVTVIDAGRSDTVVTVAAEGAVLLQGFTLANGRGASGGAIESDGTDLTITDCVLRDHEGDDATISVEGGSLSVRDSEVRDNVAQYAAVIEADGADVYLERVLVQGNEAEDDNNPVAILLEQAGTVEVFNTLLVDNDVANAVFGTWTDITFVNNTLVGRMTGIQGGQGGTNNAFVQNNIFSSEEFEVTYAVGAYIGDVTFDYNDHHNFLYGLCAGTCTSTEPVDGNLNVDPRFSHADAGDYTLDALSPCIDAGNPASAYDDLDGTPADMGAYGGQRADW